MGTPFLRIEGVDRLIGVEHTVIPDRIEAATLMVAAAITRGDVRIENVCLTHLTAVIEKLREIGVRIELSDSELSPIERIDQLDQILESLDLDDVALPFSNGQPKQPQRPHTQPMIRVRGPVGDFQAVDATALPYPGLATDVQAQVMTLLCLAKGISVVSDKVFPDRFMHASELVRLGATIRREGPSAIISGVGKLSGACVMASDLRASAALVLAGLAAAGDTVVKRIYHLDRGYEALERKLNSLGAEIRRIEDKPENMPRSLCLAEATGEPPASFDAPHFLRLPTKEAGNVNESVTPQE